MTPTARVILALVTMRARSWEELAKACHLTPVPKIHLAVEDLRTPSMYSKPAD